MPNRSAPTRAIVTPSRSKTTVRAQMSSWGVKRARRSGLTHSGFGASLNSVARVFAVTVNDNEPPTISSSQFTVDNDPGQAGAVFNYPDPTVSDNAPGVTFTCSVSSGSFFNIGGSTFTCTATDTSGNTATGFILIEVNDVEPPVITLNGNNPVNLLEGATYIEAGATITDNSGEDLSGSLVIDASAVDTSTVGAYLVTYDVSDSAGNAAQVTRTVQVITAAQATQQTVVELQNIIDNNPGTPLANTVQGAQASTQTAITELNKNNTRRI